MRLAAGDSALSEQRRIVVSGFIGLLPTGGVTWDYLQYPLGFHLLGHDVLYLEDTGLWPTYSSSASGVDCASNVAYLNDVMGAFGLSDRWAYHDAPSDRWWGRAELDVERFCERADVFVNVSASSVLRDACRSIPVRVLIDTDPMFTQVQYVTDTSFTPGEAGPRALVDGHTHHFSFGELVGRPGCAVPTCDIGWQPTRQPICLDHWTSSAPRLDAPFTTVMNWAATEPIHFGGDIWGQKDIELLRFLEIPARVPEIRFAPAINQSGGPSFPFPRGLLEEAGWHLRDPSEELSNWKAYQSFIRASAGEFGTTKHAYVHARTGWFSCRSACYLASGRPVVAQDTGWTDVFPSGRGLLAFSSPDEAVDALRITHGDLQAHGLAARELAERFFDSRHVLTKLLADAGLDP